MNIFRRWLATKTEQQTDDSQNPWAGLASYEDPETAARKLLFCGRDDESYDVAKLIMGNIFVTLYGKSGIGKTSLLNAGVFPELREEQYTPLSLRLGMRDETNPQRYQSMIVGAVERKVSRFETIDVIDEQQDEQAADYLWNYFARHRFYDKNGEPTTPVLVFDQFEEVFRSDREEAETLLRQLDYINDKDHALDNCSVEGRPYRYEQNFRFVVSIREDDLYRLEDSLDNCYLPALKRCRYRLRSLSEQGARDAILIPGKGLFKAEEEKGIADRIIAKSKNEDGSISTNIVSLLCSRIFVDYQRSGADHITPTLVDSFLKGNPFERFYNEATRGFSNREKSYIEDNLVDVNGRRNSIPESNFLSNVKNGAVLLDGERKILQRTSTSSDGGNYRVELIHDSFCEPLSTQKEKRERRKRRWQMAGITGVALLSVAIILYVWNINQKMRINESRVIAEKASRLVDEGDSYLARLMALQALPPNRPYTVEAESALRKACQYNHAILRGHTSGVTTAFFSPDGKRIVSASWDNTVRIWDAATGMQIGEPLTGHTGWVSFATFSPDGKRIVSASYDKTIRIWDAATGKQIGQPLKGHVSTVYSASFSPDGKRIVSASADKTIRIWDTETGQQIGQPLKGHASSVLSACFSPDSKRIASASVDGSIRIWDADTGRQIGKPLEGHLFHVTSVSFSPDGKQIVSSSYDRTIRIWDAETGQQIGRPFENHSAIVQYASFSPDGKSIVSASADHTVCLSDTTENRSFVSISLPLIGHTDWVNSASFSPDGKRIVSASKDYTIRIWEIKTVQQIGKLLDGWHTGSMCYASFSPDCKRISNSLYDTIRVWNTETGQQIGLPLEGLDHCSASFSPDGKRIVSASDDNTIRIWDAGTGKQIGLPLKGHTSPVNSVSFSPDGKHIISTSDDKTIRIWDVKTRRQIFMPLEGHTGVTTASFSPDGKRIVSASYDNTIRIWDIKTRQQIGKSLEGHTQQVNAASFSPDGKHIVSASDDNTIRIWDAVTGLQITHPLEGHTSRVYSVSYSHNGKLIISVSADKTIRIWNAETGRQICQPLEGYSTSGGYAATFSPDDKRIVVASDGEIIIWDFPPIQQLIDETNTRFKNRQLTPEERQKYYLE